MENEFTKLAKLYEGYRGQMIDIPSTNFKGRPPTLDYSNSYMPHGVANSGGADNAYAAGQLQPGGFENEESPKAKAKLEEFCNDLRDRGHEAIANELAIVIKQAFEKNQ